MLLQMGLDSIKYWIIGLVLSVIPPPFYTEFKNLIKLK